MKEWLSAEKQASLEHLLKHKIGKRETRTEVWEQSSNLLNAEEKHWLV